jgi:peptidoglycan/LPS O-acetylase OafA/YrhL
MSVSEADVPDVRIHSAHPQRFYHPELDSLRFFAFLLVFCRHSLYAVTGPDCPEQVGWK